MTYEGEEPIDVNGKKVVAFKESGEWTIPEGVTNVDVLVVAGGGGGGGFGGGGGAGGLIFKPNHYVEESINITVGNGGNGGTDPGAGDNGGDSSFDSLIAKGGGGGGHGATGGATASDGGSGGGGGSRGFSGGAGIQPTQSGESGEWGFGNEGGNGSGTSGNNEGAGGGGGAKDKGGNGISGSRGGHGGDGKDYSTQLGTTYGEDGFFAGGGGGMGDWRGGLVGGNGGSGGGGKGGGPTEGSNGENGIANTGGGGGGGTANGGDGGNGGSGIVLIAYEEQSFTIKGIVNLNASPVEGAKVSCINQNTNELVGHTTSDENGEWEFSDLNEYSTDLLDGLVSYWKFDETTGTSPYDEIRETTGTISNSNMISTGKLNNGLQTDATGNQQASLGSIYDMTTEDFSVSFWVYWTGDGAWFLTNSGSGSSTSRFGIYHLGDNKLTIFSADGSTGINSESTNTLNTNAWYHIVLTRTGSTAKLYINNNEETLSMRSGSIGTTNDWYFLSRNGGGIESGKGDELGIWSRVLSSDEVEQLYDIQKDGYEDGSYPFNKLKNNYHVVASLEDGEYKFNHLSFYDIEPKLEDE